MSTADDIAGVEISSNIVYPKGTDFETILFVCSHAYWPERVRLVANLDELTDAGVPTYHPMYRALQAARKNEIKPKRIAIGRRLLPSTQVTKITPIRLDVGYFYRFTVVDAVGVSHAIEVEVETGDDAADVADKIQAELDPIAGFVPVSALGVVTSTATAGLLIEFKDLPPISEMTFQDTSANPGIETDLAAIKIAAGLAGIGFFGVCIDHNAETLINAAASWIDATQYCALWSSTDSGCAIALTTTDVMSDLKTAGVKRSFCIFAQSSNLDFRAVTLLSQGLSGNLPGTFTYAHKSLPGITVDKLTEGERAAIEAKNGTWYANLLGLPDTFESHTPEGGWFDLILGNTWIASRIQTRVYAWLRARKIRTYTDKTIKALTAEVKAGLDEGIKSGFLSDEFTPIVLAVPVSEIPTDIKAARRLTDVISFEARYGNAIHGVVIKGTFTL